MSEVAEETTTARKFAKQLRDALTEQRIRPTPGELEFLEWTTLVGDEVLDEEVPWDFMTARPKDF